MLYLVGVLMVQVAPFNIHEVSASGSTEYAVKPIVGVEPPLEFVGEGANELSLSGRLFPHSLGGMSELELLDQMRASGKPQYVMRGDGKPLGYFAILSAGTRSSFLDRNGVGKQIDVSVKLRRAQAPAPQSYFSLFAGWF